VRIRAALIAFAAAWFPAAMPEDELGFAGGPHGGQVIADGRQVVHDRLGRLALEPVNVSIQGAF
jgi:hypothetical protein